jgi:hypothetical protein
MEKKKRAQAWGFDLVAGLSIFIVGILVFFLYSLNYSNQGDATLKELEYEASAVGDSLLSNGIVNDAGVPKEDYHSGWDIDDVQKVGILSEGKINETKLKYFYQMSDSSTGEYIKVKSLLNIKNEFWVDFSEPIDFDGILPAEEGIGLKPTGEKNIIKSNRIVSYNNKIRNMYIYIWN